MSFKNLENRMKDHEEQDRLRFEAIENKLDVIKDNHLSHMQTDMASLKTNVDWLMRYHWITITAAVGAAVSGVANLLL